MAPTLQSHSAPLVAIRLPATGCTGDKLPLEDLSKNSYNLIGFYEYQKFSARIAYNWRSSYLDKSEGRNLQPQYERDRGQLDFSTSYKLTNKIKLALNAINVLEDAKDQHGRYEIQDFSKRQLEIKAN